MLHCIGEIKARAWCDVLIYMLRFLLAEALVKVALVTSLMVALVELQMELHGRMKTAL